MECTHRCDIQKYLAVCLISIKAMCLSIKTMSRAVPSTWVPSKQHSWATWEEAGLPYWVWKRRAQGARVRLYLVRKLELWRINRAEMFLVEGRKKGGGEKQSSDEEGQKMRREKRMPGRREDVGEKMERMNNRVGCNNCSHQSLSKWEDSRDGSWSKWGDDEECGTLVAIWLWVCGMLHNISRREEGKKW